MSWIFHAVYQAPAHLHPELFPWISLAAIILASVISGWLLTKFCPEAAGSGIPQLKLAFWKDFGYMPARTVLIKFLASGLSIGSGMSLGREGPSVQLGGNLASVLAGRLGVAKQRRRAAAAAGAAAGLAAAFNAPLAAVAFVLEEILEDLNSRLLGQVLLAAIAGAFVVHAVLGAQPAFDLPRIEEPDWKAYVLMPLVSVIATLAGACFQRSAIGLRTRAKNWRRLPPMWRPLLAGLITWCLGMLVYSRTGHLGVFSLGYEDLSLALAGGIAWKLALVLLVAKLVSTIACYGLGGAGGIFSPSLFFGGMCGVAVSSLANPWLHLSQADSLLLAVGGMSACLVGVVQAPVTAVLIIFEMTHQFSLVPGLLISVLLAQYLARRLNHTNFYEEILSTDGHKMEHVVPPRDLRAWQGLPVSTIASFDPVILDESDPAKLQAILQKSSHQRFPVYSSGSLAGVLSRIEMAHARAEQRPFRLSKAVKVRPSQTIRECQALLIESETGMVIVVDPTHGTPIAVVTLHDMLRAQTSFTEREG